MSCNGKESGTYSLGFKYEGVEFKVIMETQLEKKRENVIDNGII